MHLARRRPDIGESVGEYKIVELLGMGGLGIVFKVERSGSFFAMKFLTVPRLDGRAKREISILNHLDNPHCVRYVGSDYWPNPKAGLPFIVMEYVPGDTLEAFAMRHNPEARKVMRIVRDIARTLGEVHAKGVFHRDLKPSNVIIRGAAEQPVLIDFGVASLVGAAGLTAASIPPGTDEYRAPEPLRFARQNEGSGKRYEFACSDELWSLGVLFYWLLTDVLPFGECSSTGEVAELYERILHERPRAPHVVNPRVPLAASHLCMKMLSEWPADRFQTVPELYAALQAALTKADDDPAWGVPLIDPNAPQLAATIEDPVLREPDESLRAFRAAGKWRPRRGQVPPNGELDRPQLLAQVDRSQSRDAYAEQDSILTVDAPGRGSHPTGVELLGVAAPAPTGCEQLGPALPRHRRRPRWLIGIVASLAAVVAVGVSVIAVYWGLGAPNRTRAARPALPSPSTPSAPGSAQADVSGREVAHPPKPLESLPGEGAAPLGAPPPAPPANAMPRTPAQTKKNETPTQRAELRLPVKSTAVVAAAIAGCTLVEGCTGSTAQVRSAPPAISCPQDWRKTHERFHVTGRGNTTTVKGYKGEPREVFKVKDGPVTLQVGEVGSVGNLPDGTLLDGAWKVSDDRLFGTFTEAKIPGVGTLPVCLVAGLEGVTVYVDEHGNNFDCPIGLGVCLDPGSTPGDAKTPTRIFLIQPSGQP